MVYAVCSFARSLEPRVRNYHGDYLRRYHTYYVGTLEDRSTYHGAHTVGLLKDELVQEVPMSPAYVIGILSEQRTPLDMRHWRQNSSIRPTVTFSYLQIKMLRASCWSIRVPAIHRALPADFAFRVPLDRNWHCTCMFKNPAEKILHGTQIHWKSKSTGNWYYQNHNMNKIY